MSPQYWKRVCHNHQINIVHTNFLFIYCEQECVKHLICNSSATIRMHSRRIHWSSNMNKSYRKYMNWLLLPAYVYSVDYRLPAEMRCSQNSNTAYAK